MSMSSRISSLAALVGTDVKNLQVGKISTSAAGAFGLALLASVAVADARASLQLANHNLVTVDGSGNAASSSFKATSSVPISTSQTYVGIGTEGGYPAQVMNYASGPTNAKLWDVYCGGDILDWRCVNDATNSASSWLTVRRSGQTPSTIAFPYGNILLGTTTSDGVNLLQVAGSVLSKGNVTIGDSGVDADRVLNVIGAGGARNFGLSLSGTKRLYSNTSDAQSTYLANANGNWAVLDLAGNLGLGVTPSAWYGAVKAFQVGAFSVADQSNTGYSFIARNAYANSSNVQTYIANGYATRYQQGDGTHSWQVAPSGTAGAAISFTQAMTLTSGSRLLLNTTADDVVNQLQVSGSGKFTGHLTTLGKVINELGCVTYGAGSDAPTGKGVGSSYSVDVSGNATVYKAFWWQLGANNEAHLFIGDGSTTFNRAVTVGTTGNLGLGVVPSAWTSAASRKAIQFPLVGQVAAQGVLVNYSNSYYDGTNDRRASSAGAGVYTINADVHLWGGAAAGGSAGDIINFATRMTLDASGNLGLGVTPMDWGAGKALQIDSGAALWGLGGSTYLLRNAYYNGGYKYIASGVPARLFVEDDNGFTWNLAPSGTAGAAISFTQGMRLKPSAMLQLGADYGDFHTFEKMVAANAGNPIAGFYGNTQYSLVLTSVNGAGYSYSNTAAFVAKDATTNRSINAGGTVNASGADYAEYERNNGLSISKGSVIGFKADGTLTLTYAEAVRFGIKSTDPSYVGGDTWGSEEIVGKRPEQPVREEEETDEAFSEREAHYVTELVAWEARLEAERQTVDRIAYAGKVPVNVSGTTPGGYIIAASAADGSITGEFVADPDFAQYKRAVGRVNRILSDGRAEVAVMVH